MPLMKLMNGNSAVAEAVRQVNPDVVFGYPVIPSTSIIEDIANYTVDGKMDTEFVTTESEHSSMSGCIGASVSGGRVFTATASQGLSLMQEVLFVASSLRLPIIMCVTSRALSSPMNLYADHSDMMAQRDCGWIQLFSENPQEAYDNIIQAFKIAEDKEVRTPIMVEMDGFITSHSKENTIVQETEEIEDFLGKFHPIYSILDVESPKTIGTFNMPDYYFEHKVNQLQGIENSRKVIKEVGKEFGDRFGRYFGSFESYKMDDAQHAFVLMSSSAGTAKALVDQLRQQGEKVGVLKIRVFRPFPFHELRETLSKLKSVAVLDRSFSPGSLGGPLYNEVRSALYSLESAPLVYPYIYGLGGRDIAIKDFEKVFAEIKEVNKEDNTKTEIKYINIRE